MSDIGSEFASNDRLKSVIVGVAIVLVVTVLMIAGGSAVLFDLEPDETPPETKWDLEWTDPPVLTHDGGDAVNCEQVIVTGDLGSGETLCEYFSEDVITEGDSAELMPIEGKTGNLSLTWQNSDGEITVPIPLGNNEE